MFQLKFHRKWEAAHRFIEGGNRKTLCSQPHGHTWRVEATLELAAGIQLDAKLNAPVLFENAKKNWHQFIDDHVDHSFMCHHQDPLIDFLLRDNPTGRLLVFPGDPTTEIIAVTFKAKLQAFMDTEQLPLRCQSMTIHETATNTVVFTGAPEEALSMPGEKSHYWWHRADFSQNDLKIFPNGYPSAL